MAHVEPPRPIDYRNQLQSSLGDAYTLERELGGGGMSRVFLAEERALGRKVVVKVLAPELSAGVNAERFSLEIQLAARLQQAQIVPDRQPLLVADFAAGKDTSLSHVVTEAVRTDLGQSQVVSIMLYEAKGDTQRAASHYVAFIDLWKNADPELQPKVLDAKRRLARLPGVAGR